MPEDPSKNPLTCKCGNTFGNAFYRDGVFIGAQVGSVIVDESLHGRCPQCGRGIHIVVARKAMLKLLSHYYVEAPALEIEISESRD